MKKKRFKKDEYLLQNDSQYLALSDLVIITFEFQRNNKRNRTQHIFKTDYEILCPVKAWANTITQIQNTVPQGVAGNPRKFPSL